MPLSFPIQEAALYLIQWGVWIKCYIQFDIATCISNTAKRMFCLLIIPGPSEFCEAQMNIIYTQNQDQLHPVSIIRHLDGLQMDDQKQMLIWEWFIIQNYYRNSQHLCLSSCHANQLCNKIDQVCTAECNSSSKTVEKIQSLGLLFTSY